MPKNPYLELTPVKEAFDIWISKINQKPLNLGKEKISLKNSFYRILAEPVKAELSSPATHLAAMDGIAVKAEDTFSASSTAPLLMTSGKDAFWVNTGNVLPDNTNAVIMIENLNQVNKNELYIEKAAVPWQHVRKMGEDIVETEIVLTQGTRIEAYEIGALAAAGVWNVPVYKKPEVIILPSGSDLIRIEDTALAELRDGHRLPEFNSLIFSAMIKEWGGFPRTMEIAQDNPVEISSRIMEAAEAGADIIILNAGTSAGDRDFSAEAIMKTGEIVVHGVAMMPGKPTILGVVNHKDSYIPIIGAPGYPVSACLSLEQFVLPLFAYWQNSIPKQRENIDVISMYALPSKAGIEEKIRVKLGTVNNRTYAIPLPRGAGTVTSLSRADALISVPANCEGINAGQVLKASLLKQKEQIENAILAIGSHDNTLDVLDSLLRKYYPKYALSSAHTGSLGGLLALGRGQAHIAGTHLLDPETGVYNRAAIREQIPEIPLKLVRLVDRQQGLMVKKGNPLNIYSIEDIVSKGARFINRQKGSGTRLLFDHELKKKNIPADGILGYNNEEYTHMNVAAAIASDRADAGMGIQSSAIALDIDFIPVGMEEYDLAIPDEFFETDRIKALLDIIRSQEFKDAVLQLGGYGVERTGEIIWEYEGK